MAQVQRVSRKAPSSSLTSSLELLLSSERNHLTSGKESGNDNPNRSSLNMNVMIHGLISEILDLDRGLPSASSKAIHLLKSNDLKAALNRWHLAFRLMEDTERENEMAMSSLIIYHFALVLLEIDLEEIKTQAATCLKDRSAVTPLSGEQQFVSLGKSHFVEIAPEVRGHALEIIRLCLQGENTPHKSFFAAYPAYACVLILWGDETNIECRRLAQNDNHDERRASSDPTHDDETLDDIITRQQNVWTNPTQGIQSMKSDVFNLMRMVRNRLRNSLWETSESVVSR